MEYNNNGYNFSGELFSRDSGTVGDKVPVTLCSERFGTELSNDFTLPEYLPEMRKLLKVNTLIAPASKYLAASSVKLSGTVEYSILYVGGDGGVYSSVLPAEYEISAPFSTDADYNANEGLAISADVYPETVTSRVTGARRLNIRSRIGADVKVVGTVLAHGMQGIAEEEHIQKLVKSSEYCVELFGENQDIEVVDELELGGTDERYINTDCRVFVEQATAFDGYVECRGTVMLRHLVGKGCGVYGMPRKLSFSEVVELDGVSAGTPVAAWGKCASVLTSTDDDEANGGRPAVTVTARIYLAARGYKKCEMSYVKDAYSTVYECDNELETYSLPQNYACGNRNMTLSETKGVDSLGGYIDGSSLEIVDVTADAVGESVEQNESGKYTVNGKCRFCIVYTQGSSADRTDEMWTPDYASAEIEVPFKYECAEMGEAPKAWDIQAEAIGARARCDGESLSLGCEISVAFGVGGSKDVTMVDSCRLLDKLEGRKKGFTICYPSSEDSLWSVSKKYRATVADTARENGIDGAVSADSSQALDGIRYMIV